MKRIATKDLSGPALDFAVALAEGFDWARQWREGMLCLAGPRRIVSLAPSGGDPLAPAAFYEVPHFSSRPEYGHPIVEREGISVIRCHDDYGTDAEGFTTNVRIPVWCATTGQYGIECTTEHQQHDDMYQVYASEVMYGPTALVAAMRCRVANKLGRFVDVPEELVP